MVSEVGKHPLTDKVLHIERTSINCQVIEQHVLDTNAGKKLSQTATDV
jgi:hypothetical protein